MEILNWPGPVKEEWQSVLFWIYLELLPRKCGISADRAHQLTTEIRFTPPGEQTQAAREYRYYARVEMERYVLTN